LHQHSGAQPHSRPLGLWIRSRTLRVIVPIVPPLRPAYGTRGTSQAEIVMPIKTLASAPRCRYADRVTGLLALRKRMPLIVFLLLALLLLMLVGLACACLTDDPMQAIERVVNALAQLPTVAVAWTFMFATVLLAMPRLQPQNAGRGRASPAALQRFLF